MKFEILLSLILLAFIVLATRHDGLTYADPIFKDGNLKAELVAQGLDSPTSMAFVDKDNILVLEKNSGEVRLVSNGILIRQPVIKLNVDHTTLTCCRGLLGIAVIQSPSLAVSKSKTSVLLYYSEKL